MSPRDGRPDVAVVGGGYAGLMAAGRLAIGGRSVVLIDPKPHFVHRLELHRRLAGKATATRAWSRVLPRGVERLEGRATAWQDGVLGIRTRRGVRELRPRRVVITTGSRSRNPWREPLVVDLEHLDAARALVDRDRVVVVGGGATGVETAVALARSGHRVTLAAEAFTGVSDAGSDSLRDALTRIGVTLVRYTVNEVGEGAAYPAAGSPIPCDAVVPCIGFAPSPSARALGLPTDERGRVPVSASLEVAPHTYAAGDTVCVPSMPWLGGGAALAMPQGAHVAASILADLAGEPPPPFRFGWESKNFDLGGARGVLQLLESDGTPGLAVVGIRPAVAKALVLAVAPRLARWEAALGRPLYSWNRGPRLGDDPLRGPGGALPRA